MTPEEFRLRCLRIREIGCLACRRLGWFSMPEVHHLNVGGHAGHKRRGDDCTIGLCSYHHRGVPLDAFLPDRIRDVLGPSLAREPRAFRELFGSDDGLLAWQNELIEEAGRAAASCFS